LIVRCPDKEAGDKRWDMVTKWLDEGKKYATFRAIAVDGTEAAFVPGAYFQVVEINVKDQKGYEGSGVASVRDSMKAEGGTVIGGGYNKAHSLIGDAPANRYLIIQYPSKAANDKHFTASVKPWWEGEGRKYSDFRAVGVEGVASTTAQTDAGGVKAASQAFYAALNARDSNAMAKVYAHTPYVVHISPVAKEIDTGWDAVNKGWEETFQKMTSKIDVSFNAAGAPQIDGDMAWEVGTEKGSLTFADGKTVPFAAFATNVFQKIGGHWQLVAHQAGLLPK
jgi:ketosteroid isomerase-like protein/uncharacterized protein (DUF1330 family)